MDIGNTFWVDGANKKRTFFFSARRLPGSRRRRGVKARRSLPQGSLDALAAPAKLQVWLEIELIMSRDLSFLNLADAMRPEEHLPDPVGQGRAQGRRINAQARPLCSQF